MNLSPDLGTSLVPMRNIFRSKDWRPRKFVSFKDVTKSVVLSGA